MSGGTPSATAVSPAESPLAVEVAALPAPHHDLLRTTAEVLSHFYPASPPAAPACDAAADAAAENSEEASAVNSSTSSDSPTAVPVAECGTPLPIAPVPWSYTELPFLSVADQMRAQAGAISSDDADEHTPLLTLVSLLVRLAVPVAVTHMLRLSMSFMTTVFMGHYLATATFAAAATGLSFTNLSAMSIGAGFSSALDTLATQEHGRRKHSPEIAAIFLRSVVCTFVTYTPIAVLYFFCDPLLALLIHKDLVADTAYFLRMSIFIVVPMMLINNLIKFSQSQRVTQLGLVSSAAGAITLLPLLFIFRNAGLPGIIAALSVNRVFTLGVIVLCVLRDPGLRQCWAGRSLTEHITAVLMNASELWKFARVGLPVLAANCADSGSFEVLALTSARLGATSAAVWSIVMMVYSLLFAGYVGLASASSIRVGNAMGSGKGLLARHYSYATAVIAVTWSVVMVTVLWTRGGLLFHYMQSSDAVTRLGETMTSAMAVTFFFDSLFYAMQGPFRGTGYNGVLLGIIVFGMWGVAVPTGLVLTLQLGHDVRGLMFGLAAGVLCNIPLQLGYLWCLLPWQQRAREASCHA